MMALLLTVSKVVQLNNYGNNWYEDMIQKVRRFQINDTLIMRMVY